MAELVHDVRNSGVVGLVVHEHDDPCASQDHFRKRGPVVQAHGNLGWIVDVVNETRILNRSGVVSNIDIVAVDDQDGDDVVRVCLYPFSDGGELRLKGTSIEDLAGGMATVDSIVDVVRLSLDHANSVVQLVIDTQSLIGSDVTPPDKGRVVGTDFGDVAVLATAELWVAIARLCVRSSYAGARRSCSP